MPSWDSDRDIPELRGKVAIVTGGNTGIGKEVVRQLARHGAKVYMASRTESRARTAIEELLKAYPDISEKGGSIDFLQLDLTDLKRCQAAAKEFLAREERLDILVNNAGIMATPYELTKDGYEIQFQSNYLGHFAFTHPLIPLLIQTSKLPNTSVRIVQVSSYGHNFATGIKGGVHFDTDESVNRDFDSPWKRYGQSKLSNILFAKALNHRLSEYRIWSNVCHPGTVQTELTRGTKESYPWAGLVFDFLTLFLSTPYKGGLTPLYLAAAQEVEEKNYRGQYFIPYSERTDPSKLGQDDQLAEELWAFSERAVAEKCGGLA